MVGGIWRLTCSIDNRQVRVEEVGDVGDVHNWPHDGARLKDAASDALKRCAMRLGLGLHLWAQEHYFLDQQLKAQHRQSSPTDLASAEKLAAVSSPTRRMPRNRLGRRPAPRSPHLRGAAAAAPRGHLSSQFGGSRHRSSFNLGADKERVWGIRKVALGNGDRGDHRIVVE